MMDSLRGFLESGRPTYRAAEQACKHPLDRNENLLVPRSLIAEVLESAASKVDPRLYVGGEEQELVGLLADQLSVDREMVNITNGADDAIDLAVQLAGAVAATRPRVLTFRPTFPMYAVRSLVRGCGVDYVAISENGFSVDPAEALEKASGSDLVFVCSPNNPTGNLFDRSLIRGVAESTRGLVVVDQTYVDFAEDSQEDLVDSYENLAVIRSFSKSYGLAGLRLGYVVASRDVSKAIRMLRLPYHTSRLTMRVGIEVLRMRDEFMGYVKEVKRLREFLVSRLGRIRYLEPHRTQTNFVLAKCSLDLDAVDGALRSRGICVKLYRGLFGEGDQYIRVAVPREDVIELLVDTLEGAAQ